MKAMKAYLVCWKRTEENDEDRLRGSAIVVAESITKAIARFQRTNHAVRVIESVCQESDDVLLDLVGGAE